MLLKQLQNNIIHRYKTIAAYIELQKSIDTKKLEHQNQSVPATILELQSQTQKKSNLKIQFRSKKKGRKVHSSRSFSLATRPIGTCSVRQEEMIKVTPIPTQNIFITKTSADSKILHFIKRHKK